MPEVIKATSRAVRVLVVEDNASIGMPYAGALAEMGHIVCAIAATEAAVVAEAARCKPDPMIVDALVDEGRGVAAVGEILHTGFVPPVLVSGDAVSVRALRPGAIAMQTPFLWRKIGNAIQRVLAGI
ncbi:MAG TPA: response regulator [Rhodopila sp.]|nr:response regulator [Rhodopila sp.]